MKKNHKFFVSDPYRTIQKPLKFDTKEFENRLKIAILKNATLELGVSIGKQKKNRP